MPNSPKSMRPAVLADSGCSIEQQEKPRPVVGIFQILHRVPSGFRLVEPTARRGSRPYGPGA